MTTDRPPGTPRHDNRLGWALVVGLTVTASGVSGAAFRGNWGEAGETLVVCLVVLGVVLGLAYLARRSDQR